MRLLAISGSLRRGSHNTRLLRVAVDYWAAYPNEVAALVDHAARTDDAHRAAAERARGLLAG